MADTPAPRGGGFNWRSPGAKEYIIVFVVALGGLWVWNHFRGGSSSASTSAPSGGGTVSSSPTGLSTTSLVRWFHDHASSPSGLYFHANPESGQPYFTKGGERVTEPSGDVQIGGNQYYYHGDPKKGGAYFSQAGKRVSPPSGAVS